MSNTEEKRDEDERYLHDHAEKVGRMPTEEQVDDFCERVSIMIIDGKVPETDARRLAFKAIFE